MFLVCLQEASEASYVATMKTVRQVKTVFIIFIAFVCCWSPYIVVLLYDRSDSLPLSVHLYTSMLAHLHASLNFVIYSLSDQTFRAAYRHLAVCLMFGCCRRNASSNSAAVAARGNCDASRTCRRTAAGYTRGVEVNRPLVTFGRV